MAWTTINYKDYTPYVRFGRYGLSLGMNDTMPTLSFDVVDVGSQLTFMFGHHVIVWDEYAPPDHTFSGQAIQTVPTQNFLQSPNFDSGATNYTTGGVNSALVSFATPGACTIVFANNSFGLANDAHATQTCPLGYIQPGQPYMFSVYVKPSGTPVAVNYYFQINWLDGGLNLISSSITGNAAPPGSQQRLNVQAVAPAGAAYAQIQIGAYATAGTNSGGVAFTSLMLEPVWFPNDALGNGQPISYPSPDCNFGQATSTLLPDGTFSRTCRLFWGYISNVEVAYEGTKRTWTIDCKSYGDILENGGVGTPINQLYVGLTDAQIISNVVSTYFPGLISTGQPWTQAQSSTVVTGPVVDSIQFTDQTFRQVLNALVDVSGFAYWVDPYGYLWYVPLPYNYAPISLLADPNNQPDNISTFAPQNYKYINDGTQIRNSVKVTGGQFQLTFQDTFNGDGATKLFNLSNPPATNIVSISVNGGTSTYAPTPANKIGVAGQQVNGVGGIVALMSSAGTTVTFNVAPPSGTNNVVIIYTINAPVTILVEENNSIAQFGRRFVATVSDSSLSSNAAAKVRGEAELAQWAYPVQVLQFRLSNKSSANPATTGFIPPGTTIYLTSALDNLTLVPFVIQTCKASSMGGGADIYDYQAGIYRPTMKDIHRNVQKALLNNLGAPNTAPIQLTYEVIRDVITSSDSVSFTVAAGNGPYVYGQALYGQSSFS